MRHSPYVTVRWCFKQECVCSTVRGQTLYREKHRTHLATVRCIDLNADILKVNAGLGKRSNHRQLALNVLSISYKYSIKQPWFYSLE